MDTITIGKYIIKILSLNTVIVGTGAAGFNAADRLYSYGQKDIAIVTEHINAGTSRNTGSDKQTYYKLTLSGDEADSVRNMADTLFKGQCVDGDIALCEAALSAQSFLKLVELGVPFPCNRYGEYIGYKTDHDPARRATSVGPYTSKKMTECLEKAVNDKGIKVYDKLQVIKILKDNDNVTGLLCLNLASENDRDKYVAFNCKNIIYATGGPAGMYSDSVFPFGHYGATGIAFEAGVIGKNLTEWQYGLASTKPRWNVSGTYMQVLPKFISRNSDGSDEKEFLFDFFKDKGDMLTKVFLKGYQWPFDVRKIDNGSSIIDILVYIETLKGRKVYLDFRGNPNDEDIDFKTLSSEAYEYLDKAGACFGTPFERLNHMNSPAVEFYLDKGVDLEKEPLKITLCAQHNNGGLSIDCWWQTNIKGFYAVGEVAGSHGVYRPGGSALNAGQVGSSRAAKAVSVIGKGNSINTKDFIKAVQDDVGLVVKLGDSIFSIEDNVKEMWDKATVRMSNFGSAIRNEDGIKNTLAEIKTELENFSNQVRVSSHQNLAKGYRLYDILICQYVYLNAMYDYIKNGGKSRGSALYTDKLGTKPYESLSDMFRFILDDGSRGELIQEVLYKQGVCSFDWRKIRPIPEDDSFFENVWRNYRENGNVDNSQ